MSNVAYKYTSSVTHLISGTSDDLKGFIQEILNAAFLVAASASIANYSAVHGLASTANNSMASHLPPPFKDKPDTSWTSLAVADHLQGQLQTLSETLVLVCEMSRLVASVGSYSPDLVVFADSWRRAANQALVIFAQLQEEPKIKSTEDLQLEVRLACTLLTAASRGDWPCIDEDGKVNLPVAVERRDSVRAHSGRYAFFDVGGSIQRAMVENVSGKGLGIFGLTGGEPGTTVTLMLAPGSTIDGQIVWVQGKQAGIRFAQPLPLPLLDALIY